MNCTQRDRKTVARPERDYAETRRYPGGLGGFPPNELRKAFPLCSYVEAMFGGALGGNPPKPP